MAYLDDLRTARDRIANQLATMTITENYSAEGRSFSSGTHHAQLVASLAKLNAEIKTAENIAVSGTTVAVAAEVVHFDGGIFDGGYINPPG